MSTTILLTSFDTWKPSQKTNASDDLLLAVLKTQPSSSLHFLRQLPVDAQQASEAAIAQINHLHPNAVICCGMAKRRTRLSLESRAIVEDQVLQTNLDLKRLMTGLPMTRISHNAGRFVCNQVYYIMLKHLQEQSPARHCVFVHVPVLTAANEVAIVTDFCTILGRIAELC